MNLNQLNFSGINLSVLSIILLFSFIPAPVYGGLGKASPEVMEAEREAYRNMSKAEKKTYRQGLKSKIKKVKERIKEIKKERRSNNELGTLEWAGIILFLAGLLMTLIMAALGIGVLAVIGGLVMVAGVVLFILAFVNVI